MEEESKPVPVETQEEIIDPTLCVNCQKDIIEEGYPTKICSGCRHQFINYPIPKWIWLFASGILVVMIIGMIRMPKYISAAYHLSKAEKAMEARAYYTAQKELLLVIEKAPENLLANGNLLIAAAYNSNYALAGLAYENISGKQIDDNAFYSQIQDAIQIVEGNFPADTTVYSKIAMAKDSAADLINIYDMQVMKNNIDQSIVGVYVANRLYDMKLYKEAEKILNKVLLKSDRYYPAISLMVAVKRNLKMYDHAIAFCDQMLERNSEDVIAFVQKAKVEIRRNDDARAAEYATKAMEIDSTSTYAMEALAMVDFYTGKKEESRKLLSAIQQQEAGGDTTITVRLRDIINGKTQYR